MLFGQKSEIKENDVLKMLSRVKDPDLNRDIVSLGFVKNLHIKGGKVAFDVELTTPACPVKDQLKAQCEEQVKSLSGVKAVEVNMTANVRGGGHQHAKGPQGAPGQQGQGRISLPGVKNLIAIASGKGGVGKSTVALNLAVSLSKTGARVGLLDADIYGPSMPLMMGIDKKPAQAKGKILPIVQHDLKVMSMGFLTDDKQPVVWRGPMVHGALTQFMTHVAWGELDYLLIDMPPGTGDAQLTISQTAPLAGAVIVTTPQEVSLIDARKGLHMFKNVHVPVLGIIENMSGFKTPDGQVHHIFREGGGQRLAEESETKFLGAISIYPEVAEAGDSGTPIVLSKPDSEASQNFSAAAKEMAAALSTLQATSAGFEPVSLEWQ